MLSVNCCSLWLSKRSLSFLQLTPGLYEFKVIVGGQSSHGEGYVNVTVKPGMYFPALTVSLLLPLQESQRERFDFRVFLIPILFFVIYLLGNS